MVSLKAKIGTSTRIPDTVNALIFGDSGAGKTYALSTAPKPLLIANVDNSITSLPPSDDIYIYPDPETEGRPIRTWEELDELHSYLEQGGIKELGITTYAIDTITEAGHLLSENLLSKEGPTGRVHERVMSQADYGLFGSLMLDEVRRIRDLPVNTILTAQCRDDTVEKPEGGREMWRMPDFGAGQQASQKSPTQMDMVGYIGVSSEDMETRKLLVQPVNNRKAKIRTRSGKETPTVIENPNLEEIFNLIYKEDE